VWRQGDIQTEKNNISKKNGGSELVFALAVNRKIMKNCLFVQTSDWM
jgi:hypothetical protein